MKSKKSWILSIACVMFIYSGFAQPLSVESYRWLLKAEPVERNHYIYQKDYGSTDWATHYINIGWQFNIPVNNSFASKANGWGAYLEGGYYFTRNFALGGFISYNTNNEYIPRQTYQGQGNSSYSTDKQHSLFQVPFGILGRYRFLSGMWQPYISCKIGTNYADYASYVNAIVTTEDSWGLYISPEIGITIHPFRSKTIGFHGALYYSYATNDNSIFKMSELNNLGVKLGFAF